MHNKRINFVNRLWIVYLFYNIIPTFGISQIPLADMTLESKLHKRWLNCKSTKLDLVAESPAQANKCYKWSERAYGTSTYFEIAHNTPEMGKQSVAPIKTYWYKCERFNNGQCSGQPEMVWYFKVYVVEAVQLTSLVLNGEYVYDLNSGINPSIPPETMDEYNDYSLQGNFTLGDIVELPKDLSMLSVNLHFTTDIGQNIPDSKPRIEDRSLRSEGFFPFVQQDGISKEYLLKIKAECCSMVSNELKILVKRLWIDRFERISNPLPPPDKNKFMVVIDDQINYKSNSTSTCTNYKWEYYSHWQLDDIGLGHNKFGTNLLINSNQIPNATITKYNSYGPKNGIVILSCFENNNKLNVSTYPIINVMLNPLRIYITKRYMGNYKSHIYYQKNDLNTTTGNPNTATPNWFYYWRKFVDMKNCINNNYNPGNSWATTELYEDFSGYTVFSDKASEVNDIPGILDKGIHVFNEVVVHESEHYDISKKLWTKFGSGVYDPNKDLDGDFYPDEFELSTDGKQANFSVKNYSPDLKDKFGIKYSNGTIFEESICKLQEINLSKNRTQLEKFDIDDWSFDRSGQIQGKNWK